MKRSGMWYYFFAAISDIRDMKFCRAYPEASINTLHH